MIAVGADGQQTTCALRVRKKIFYCYHDCFRIIMSIMIRLRLVAHRLKGPTRAARSCIAGAQATGRRQRFLDGMSYRIGFLQWSKYSNNKFMDSSIYIYIFRDIYVHISYIYTWFLFAILFGGSGALIIKFGRKVEGFC